MKVSAKLLAVGVTAALWLAPLVAASEYDNVKYGQARSGAELTVFSVAGNIGFVRADGSIAIPLQFDRASDFSEIGLAAVRQDGKWGFIRSDGRIAIRPQFDVVLNFSNYGLAAIQQDGKWGFIRADGKIAVSPQFDSVRDFSENGLAAVRRNGKWGFIRSNGDWAILPQFDDADAFSSNGLARVRRNAKDGFIDIDGNVVIPFLFDAAGSFAKTGLAAIRAENGRWGFVGSSGRFVILPLFDDVYSRHDPWKAGRALVKQGGNWGYIRQDGSFAIRPQFEAARDFGENGLAAIKQNGKWGYIDVDGAVVIDPQFEWAGTFSVGGLARVERNGEVAYIDFAESTGGPRVVLSRETRECADSAYTMEVVVSRGQMIWPENFDVACSKEKKKRLREEKERLASEQRNRQLLVNFRKSLKLETQTNCGPVLEIKGTLAKVYFPVKDYGNEHWIRRDQLFPAESECRFINGKYEPGAS